MKKTIFSLALLISAVMEAQITLEHSYNATTQYQNLSVYNFSFAGPKYGLVSTSAKQLVLYNVNHSVWKTINLPGTSTEMVHIQNISDSLFNTNPALEILCYIVSLTTANQKEVRLIDENNSTLLTLPNCAGAYPTFVKGQGWKLIAGIDSVGKNSRQKHEVYSLVGGMPQYTTKLSPVVNDDETAIMGAAVPNPSGDKAVIPYSLPAGMQQAVITICDINGRQVKQYTVDRTFNTLELNNTDLPSGTYLYHMEGSADQAKKLVILK